MLKFRENLVKNPIIIMPNIKGISKLGIKSKNMKLVTKYISLIVFFSLNKPYINKNYQKLYQLLK